jgi:hypothetical protein
MKNNQMWANLVPKTRKSKKETNTFLIIILSLFGAFVNLK